MKHVFDESPVPVNAVEATTAIDNIVDLDAPGVEYRAIKEEMPPLPLQEPMPPEWTASTPRDLMLPHYWLMPEEIHNTDSGGVRLKRRAVLKFNGIVPPESPT